MKKAPPEPRKQVTDKNTPEDPATVRASRRVLRFGGLLLLTLFVQTLDLPWRLLTVLIGGAAAVYGFMALVTAWKAGMRGLTIPAVVIGIVMSSVMALSTLLLLFIWQIEIDHQDCVNGAITVSARDTCDTTYQQDFDEWRKNMESRAGIG